MSPLDLVRVLCAATAAAFLGLNGSDAAAQSTWVNPNPPTRPGLRCCTNLATNLSGGVVWLFGGGTTAPYPNDTWSWNGATWTLHNPATSPTGRYGHSMVWDEQRGRAVLFGGQTTGGTSGETWEWDGTSWTLRTPAQSPSSRYEHAAAYDRL